MQAIDRRGLAAMLASPALIVFFACGRAPCPSYLPEELGWLFLAPFLAGADAMIRHARHAPALAWRLMAGLMLSLYAVLAEVAAQIFDAQSATHSARIVTWFGYQVLSLAFALIYFGAGLWVWCRRPRAKPGPDALP